MSAETLRTTVHGLIACLLCVSRVFAASTLDQIERDKTLRVCIWPDYFGISYRNPKTGQLSGIDIALSAALARNLGVRVEYVDSSFPQLIADIGERRCDIAMFGVGITAERSARLAFSSPYLISDIYAITTRANNRIRSWDDLDTPGVVVAVAQGTFHEKVMRDRLRHARLLVLDTPFAREQEVRSGRADVFMTDYPYSRRLMTSADWPRLISPPRPYHLTSYAYALRRDDPKWLARVERFVREIKQDGRLRAAAERYDLLDIVAP